MARATWRIRRSSSATTEPAGCRPSPSDTTAERHDSGSAAVLQLIVNGVALGAAYALVALGFVLVLNATGAVNFAQGDLVMAGGFLAVALAGMIPVPGIVLLPAVMVLMAAL